MTKNWWDEQLEVEITKGLRALDSIDNQFIRLRKAEVNVKDSSVHITIDVTRKTMKELRKNGPIASRTRRFIKIKTLDEFSPCILAREVDCILVAKFLWFKVELYRGKIHNSTYEYIK